MHGVVIVFQILRAAVMHNLSGLHDVDLVGYGQCTVEILFHEQDAQAGLAELRNDLFQVLDHHRR